MNFNVCLPHFVIYGGMKCGTTSLYEYLGAHPDVLHVKEEHHFFPADIRKKISRQYQLLSPPAGEHVTWLKRDYEFRGFDEDQAKLLPKKLLPKEGSGKKLKKTLKKLERPIIGSKEIRFFGPSHFKWAAYFADSFVEPFRWYVDSFPPVPKTKGTEFDENYGKISGEASPTYLHGAELVAQRMKYFLPDVRIIILLRNPVERFLSMARMKEGMKENIAQAKKEDGKEVKKRNTLTLDELIEISVAGPYEDDLTRHEQAQVSKVNKDLKGSKYAQKIQFLLKNFDPEQILVIQSEYFYKNPVEVMHQVEEFLGLRKLSDSIWEKVTSKVYNLIIDGHSREFTPKEGKQGAKVEISDQSREYLQDYFRESNNQLAKLLNLEFSGWDY